MDYTKKYKQIRYAYTLAVRNGKNMFIVCSRVKMLVVSILETKHFPMFS